MVRVLASLTAADYAVLIPIFFSSLASLIVTVRNSGHAKETLRQVTPPSNGRTLGELAEGINVSSHAAAIESARVRKEVLPNMPPPLPTTEPHD